MERILTHQICRKFEKEGKIIAYFKANEVEETIKELVNEKELEKLRGLKWFDKYDEINRQLKKLEKEIKRLEEKISKL